jgi:hypothetical protein
LQDGTGVNIGRIASEIITSKLTQRQLSTKHLLEAMIDKINWCEDFYNFFDIEANVIQVTSEIDYKDLKIIIDPDEIESDNDNEDMNNGDDDDISAAMAYNEYITKFSVCRISTGEVFEIYNDCDQHLFITSELNGIIRKKAENDDGLININFNELKNIPIFVIVFQNNEITKTLNKLKSLYNKADSVRGKTVSQLFQEILDTNIEGNLNISAVHYSVLLMNQIKSADDIFSAPDWYCNNPRYQILSLNEALNNNPSITISLSYQKISKMFYAPLTYKKHGASFMDLFFMKTPQRVIKGIDEPVKSKRAPGEIYEPIIFNENPNNVTTRDPIDEDDSIEE